MIRAFEYSHFKTIFWYRQGLLFVHLWTGCNEYTRSSSISALFFKRLSCFTTNIIPTMHTYIWCFLLSNSSPCSLYKWMARSSPELPWYVPQISQPNGDITVGNSDFTPDVAAIRRWAEIKGVSASVIIIAGDDEESFWNTFSFPDFFKTKRKTKNINFFKLCLIWENNIRIIIFSKSPQLFIYFLKMILIIFKKYVKNLNIF